MKSPHLLWRREDGLLVCEWSDVGQHQPYDSPWMDEARNIDPKGVIPESLDWTRLSPFGGRRWYDPNRGYGSL